MTLRRRGYLSEGKGMSTVLKNTLVMNGIVLPGLMGQTSPLKWKAHEKKSVEDQALALSHSRDTKLMFALDKIRKKYGPKDRELVKQIDAIEGILAGAY